MNAITVLGPGCEVMIHGEVAGRIATVNIRAGGVCYEVVWMEGATRRREWVEEFEVEARHEREEVRVGFVQPAEDRPRPRPLATIQGITVE